MRTLNRNQGSNFSGSQPKGIRDSFKNYFLSASGAVEWQERAIALPTASEESDEDWVISIYFCYYLCFITAILSLFYARLHKLSYAHVLYLKFQVIINIFLS